MFVAVTNTAATPADFASAQARLDDGRLDLCIVGAAGKLRLLYHFPRSFAATHDALPEVVMAQTPWVKIESESPLHVALDGELPRLTTPLEIVCEPAALSCWREGHHHRRRRRRTGGGAGVRPSRPRGRGSERRSGPGNINRGDSLLPSVTRTAPLGRARLPVAAGARPVSRMQISIAGRSCSKPTRRTHICPADPRIERGAGRLCPRHRARRDPLRLARRPERAARAADRRGRRASSSVAERAGIPLPLERYSHAFYIVDVDRPEHTPTPCASSSKSKAGS